jgi:phage terminase large subunit-like protein
LTWIKRGHLIVTSGDTTDPESVKSEILRWMKLYQLKSVAYDGGQDRTLGTELFNQHGVPMFEFYQSCAKYNEPFRKLLVMLKDRRVIMNCPILTWAADNVVARCDAAGRIMPDKQKSVEKIDPFVATLMGLSECLFAEANPGAYFTHGLLKSDG